MIKLLGFILKNSILPASLLIVGKLLGLFIAVQIYDLDIYLDNDLEQDFSVQIYFFDEQETELANTFSDLIMFLGLLIGTIIVIVRNLLKLDGLSSKKTVAKLINLNILEFITDKKYNLTKIITWSMFLFGSYIVVMRNVYLRLSKGWLAGVGGVFLILTLGTVIKLIEKYVNKIYPQI